MNLQQIVNQYKNYDWFEELDFSGELARWREVEITRGDFLPRVVLIGEFSVGKSSIINMMLGESILPVGWRPETRYITEIKYGEENRLVVDGEKIELTTENIKKATPQKGDKIEIYLNNPVLKRVIFIDTPGTNDPNSFNDTIVFDVIGNSDVVLFVTKATQALTASEKLFLSKVIKKKDLEKFYFIINFADVVDNRRQVKQEFIRNLTSILELNPEIIKNQTHLFSVKEKDIYSYVLDAVLESIEKQKRKLMREWERQEKLKIINDMELKVEALLDKVEGRTKKYEEELEKIKAQMKNFEKEIEEDLNQLRIQLENAKLDTIASLEKGIGVIKNIIAREVEQIDYQMLQNSRYMELRIKKLVEELVEQEIKRFIETISQLVENFDQKILNSYKLPSLSIPQPTQTKGKKIVNTTALMATGAGALSLAPTIGGAIGGASLIGGVGSVLGAGVAIPGIGPALATIGAGLTGGLAIIGVFVVGAGKVLFDVGKWGVKKIGELAEYMEEQLYKKKFIREVNKQLDTLLRQLVWNIKEIDIDQFKSQYIEHKFPQKKILEKKMEMAKTRRATEIAQVAEEKEAILAFYNQLKELSNEL